MTIEEATELARRLHVLETGLALICERNDLPSDALDHLRALATGNTEGLRVGPRGELCFTPNTLSRVLGTAGSDQQVISKMRLRGDGPPFVTASRGETRTSYLYPVAGVQKWIAENTTTPPSNRPTRRLVQAMREFGLVATADAAEQEAA